MDAPLTPGLAAAGGSASSAPLRAVLLAAVVLLVGGYLGLRAWRGSVGR